MKNGLRFAAIFLLAFLAQIGFSLPQAGKSRNPPAKGRRVAPFLQHAKSYQESTYVTRLVLRNGLTILVNEFRIQPVVTLQMHVRAGTLDDPQDAPGTAKLVAAMVQRGELEKSGGTLRQSVQSFGGRLKTETGYAATVFEVIAPGGNWKRALQSQSQAILSPSFQPQAVRQEAALIRGDARGDLEGASDYPEKRLLLQAFNDLRMAPAESLLGSGIEKSTAEAAAAFHRKNYAPSNMTLVVSGDVTSSEVLNEVARLYSSHSGTAARQTPPAFPVARDGFHYGALRGEAAIPQVFFGFPAVPEGHEDYRALEVLCSVLGLGESSVLRYRLRDQKKLVLNAGARLMTEPGFGYLVIKIAADPTNIDRSEIALLTELELLKREELIDAEIERAAAQLERAYWARLETVSGRARALAHCEALGDWKCMDHYISEIRKVTATDVRRVASKYLRLEQCSLLEYLPASMEERQLKEEGVRRTFEQLLKPSADEETAERNKKGPSAIKMAAKGSFTFNEIRHPFQIASILRGPNLFIREEHTSPLIEMGLFFPGGKLHEKKENAGITELTVRSMLRGSEDPYQLSRQLEVYGGQAAPVVTDDYFGIYFSVLSQNFEPAFKLLTEAVKSPNFDEEEIRHLKEIQRAEMLSRRKSPAYPLLLLNESLFNSFPYSLDSGGTEASLASITAAAVREWYDSHVKNRKPVIALVGDTKGTSLASLFVQPFSGSRMQETTIPEEFVKALEKGISREHEWGARESLILVGFQAPPVDDEDGYVASVLQSLIGDPGSLSQSLRDRLGLAHRVSAVYEPRLRGGSFIICTAAAPGGEEAVVKALRAEIQKTREAQIQAREFRSAVAGAALAHVVDLQSRSAQIHAIVKLALAGKGIETYENYSSALRDVREEDLDPVIDRILNLDRAVIVQVRGRN